MRGLSLGASPPWSVPHRFFLTAPLFGVAAGLLVARHWEVVTTSRWASQTVAAVHLVTVGFMLQVMTGALLQLLPVAAGASVRRPRLVGGIVHPALALGAAALTSGFLGVGPPGLLLGAALLGGGVLVLAVVAGSALWRSKAIGPTLPAFKLALAGLVIAVTLGVALAATLAGALQTPLLLLVDLHAAWATLGWAFMLVVGVAWLVVPMFQLTPAYPVWFARAVPVFIVTALVAWTLAILFDLVPIRWLAVTLATCALAGFAVQTLWLQARRRRKVRDATLLSWRLAMVCFVAAALVNLALRLAPSAEFRGRLEFMLGVLLFAGGFPALITGMLYKIVGFLGWVHLHEVAKTMTMNSLLPDSRARLQLRVFMAALLFLTGAAVWAPLALPGGLLFAGSFLLLGWHLMQAARSYVSASRPATESPR